MVFLPDSEKNFLVLKQDFALMNCLDFDKNYLHQKQEAVVGSRQILEEVEVVVVQYYYYLDMLDILDFVIHSLKEVW